MMAKITSKIVQVTNTMWAPPMKRRSEIALLMIEMAIRKSGPFLFLRKTHINAAKFTTAKTAAFATAILKSTAKVTRAFPIRIVGFTVQKIIEATSATIVIATRANKILCCRSRMVQLIRLLD